MADRRPTRWQKARSDWHGRRLRDHLVVAVLGGGLAVVALIVLGSPGEVVGDAAIVAGTAVVAVLLYAGAELAWGWLQAPMRLLTADVIAIRERVEGHAGQTPPAAPVPPPKPPDVRLWLLDHIRKGEGLLGYDPGPGIADAERWAAEASEFLREHAPDDAELFFKAPIHRRSSVLTIEAQIRALQEIADRHRGPRKTRARLT